LSALIPGAISYVAQYWLANPAAASTFALATVRGSLRDAAARSDHMAIPVLGPRSCNMRASVAGSQTKQAQVDR